MKRKFTILAAACICCLSLTACGHAAQTYTEYVQAVMDCTYQGNAAAYCKLTNASEADAQSIHQEAVRYLSDQLCHQATVDRNALDAETSAGFDALAETLVGKVKYSASDAVRAGDFYQITITAEPLNIWQLSLGDLEASYKNDFSKAFYKETPGTDSYLSLEGVWGSRALEIYNAHLDEVSNSEAQSLTTVMYVNSDGHYTLSQQDWRRIDSLVFGLAS